MSQNNIKYRKNIICLIKLNHDNVNLKIIDRVFNKYFISLQTQVFDTHRKSCFKNSVEVPGKIGSRDNHFLYKFV